MQTSLQSTDVKKGERGERRRERGEEQEREGGSASWAGVGLVVIIVHCDSIGVIITSGYRCDI